MNKKNKLYNYLANTYGLSKKLVMDFVDEQIRQIVEDQVRERCRIVFQFDSNRVKFATED